MQNVDIALDIPAVIRAAQIPRVDDFRAFRAAVHRHDFHGGTRQDVAFDHSSRIIVDTVPEGMVPGQNWFGPGHCEAMTHTSLNVSKAISSFLVHDAVISPASMAMTKMDGALIDITVDNLGFWGGRLSALDPAFLDTQAGPALRVEPGSLPRVDCIALPISGVGFPNYGHFMFDGLGAVLQHMHDFRDPRLRLVGPRLQPWQAEILAAIDGLDRYMQIDAPTRFERVVFSSMLSFHTSYPTRFVRPLFDGLRFRFGGGCETRSGLIFLSRAFDIGRRVLTNRVHVEACFAEEGFDIVRPETLSVAAQARLMASSRFVAGETGSSLANVGFCDPGTQVLEILPDCYPDGWIRSLCYQLGQRWNVYFALSQQDPGDPSAPLRFSVDIDDLRSTIRQIRSRV